MTSSIPISAPAPSLGSVSSFFGQFPITQCLKAMGYAVVPCALWKAGWYVFSLGQAPIYGNTLWVNAKPTYSRNVNLLTGLPLGVGLYLVAEEIPKEVAIPAMACFILTTGFQWLGIFSYCKATSVICCMSSSALVIYWAYHMAFYFGEVNPIAGCLALPYAFWATYQCGKLIFAFLDQLL